MLIFLCAENILNSEPKAEISKITSFNFNFIFEKTTPEFKKALTKATATKMIITHLLLFTELFIRLFKRL